MDVSASYSSVPKGGLKKGELAHDMAEDSLPIW